MFFFISYVSFLIPQIEEHLSLENHLALFGKPYLLGLDEGKQFFSDSETLYLRCKNNSCVTSFLSRRTIILIRTIYTS